MSMDKQKLGDALERLARVPRERLGFFPTPFHRLKNLSEEFGVELYLKRDDLTGPATFGGNKVRKIEFLIADAKRSGAEYVITHGATQSNHAMLTAACCACTGLKPVLFLNAIVPPSENDLRANLLLDHILGAEVHIIPASPGEKSGDADRRREEAAKARIRELESKGHRCYEIPVGGASPIGTLGFVSGYIELMEQLSSSGLDDPDYVVHASGSGGTLAGLLAGRALTGSKATILSFASGPKGSEYADHVAALANRALALLGCEPLVTSRDVKVDTDFVGEGYEIPTEASTSAIKLFARREGIFFDPVYTAKALAGLVEYIRSGRIPGGSRVVFWHTGGATALFAEKAMVGRVYS